MQDPWHYRDLADILYGKVVSILLHKCRWSPCFALFQPLKSLLGLDPWSEVNHGISPLTDRQCRQYVSVDAVLWWHRQSSFWCPPMPIQKRTEEESSPIYPDTLGQYRPCRLVTVLSTCTHLVQPTNWWRNLVVRCNRICCMSASMMSDLHHRQYLHCADRLDVDSRVETPTSWKERQRMS